jgi:uncharacterized protein (DUF1800 family)
MRPRLLSLLLACAGCATAGPVRPNAAVRVDAIRSELSREAQVEHALNRLAYGPRPGESERVAAMGLERWIGLQLSPERLDDRIADSAVSGYRTLGIASQELVETFRQIRLARRDSMRAAEMRDERRMLQLSVGEVGAAKLTRAVLSERQLYEQMVDFWQNHFSVFAGKGQTRLYVPAYDRETIRPHAMGKFRTLLGAVAKSPAMLFYLDNAQSVADSSHSTLAAGRRRRPQARRARGVNENYARELMELHTLGVDGGYTQTDVVEVARALTGWTIDPTQGSFVFRPMVHDADAKVVLGTTLAGGRGMEDGEQVLDLLARHPSTARHITRKLVIRFVSDSAPPALVDRCAREFARSDGDIRRALRCVVTSPEFFSQRAYRTKVKTPFELVASALRAANATPDRSPRIVQAVAQLGQPIFGRQTPDGWPDRGEEWMNAGAMVNRVNFGLALAAGRVPGVRVGSVDSATKVLLTSPEFQKR